jgi:hypothetical protein
MKLRPGFEDLANRVHCEFTASFPEQGWDKIIIDCHNSIITIDPDYVIHQIKEKFGTLRYYIASSHVDRNKIDEIIRQAEQLSAVTCERCGEPGKLDREERWVMTLCSECTSNRKARRDATTTSVNVNEETA